jgi:predicted kinase
MLIEFSGLPATGKSTLSASIADRTGAVLLRIDQIEAAMCRDGLTRDQTGVAAYGVANAVAEPHLRRGFTVVADAVNAVEEAREGWRELARRTGVAHRDIEVVCPDVDEHRRRVESRDNDIPGLTYPNWTAVQERRAQYQERTDERLVVDSTRPLELCRAEIVAYLNLG